MPLALPLPRDERERFVIDALRQLSASAGHELLAARRITGVVVPISPASVAVAHGLGRAPLGWVVCRQRATDSVFEATDPDATKLYLSSSGGLTVDLLVW